MIKTVPHWVLLLIYFCFFPYPTPFCYVNCRIDYVLSPAGGWRKNRPYFAPAVDMMIKPGGNISDAVDEQPEQPVAERLKLVPWMCRMLWIMRVYLSVRVGSPRSLPMYTSLSILYGQRDLFFEEQRHHKINEHEREYILFYAISNAIIRVDATFFITIAAPQLRFTSVHQRLKFQSFHHSPRLRPSSIHRFFVSKIKLRLETIVGVDSIVLYPVLVL